MHILTYPKYNKKLARTGGQKSRHVKLYSVILIKLGKKNPFPASILLKVSAIASLIAYTNILVSQR